MIRVVHPGSGSFTHPRSRIRNTGMYKATEMTSTCSQARCLYLVQNPQMRHCQPGPACTRFPRMNSSRSPASSTRDRWGSQLHYPDMMSISCEPSYSSRKGCVKYIVGEEDRHLINAFMNTASRLNSGIEYSRIRNPPFPRPPVTEKREHGYAYGTIRFLGSNWTSA